MQQRPDGSFPQNSRLGGEPVFGGLQLDEVSFPIVLARQLGRTGQGDWDHVRRSADFIVDNGPSTASGLTPTTRRRRPAIPAGGEHLLGHPLAWSHAQFIRLARSIHAGRPVETPRVVACRYHTTLC